MNDSFKSEIYLLIARFLDSGPCSSASQVLKRELVEKGLVPPRYDWTGRPISRTFSDLDSDFSHIPQDHLIKLLENLSSKLSVQTLLGTGSFSLTRSPPVRQAPNINRVLFNSESGYPSINSVIFDGLSSNFSYLRKTLGHLSSVFCLVLDKTGSVIFTGADDFLVKAWSIRDGRLIHTFRGAVSEIVDLSVSHDNSLLAAGSNDKVVRIWCTYTAKPIAVLYKHSGVITSISFCPFTFGDYRYLASTSGEGAVSFWRYHYKSYVFDEHPTKYLEKIRPGQAQMICAAFSPGGLFYSVGSADHNVRIYIMKEEGPCRILEEEAHDERVDSICWANGPNLRFVSGSKDGTTLIWKYFEGSWKSIKLKAGIDDIPVKVTMVCWSIDDSLVITAVSDNIIRIWDSDTGKLKGSLSGHSDEIYVMEPHPVSKDLLLTAGHDGNVILWNLDENKEIFRRLNESGDEGNVSIYDAKWCPDGTLLVCSDSHGHLTYFGFGSSEAYDWLPVELFFHTDYRPLLRDSFHNVVDEQTQISPHLLPTPFLVDSEGFPYPQPVQRAVRGRETLENAQIPARPEPSFNASNNQQPRDLLQEAQDAAIAAVHSSIAEGVVNPPILTVVKQKHSSALKIQNDLEKIKMFSEIETKHYLDESLKIDQSLKKPKVCSSSSVNQQPSGRPTQNSLSRRQVRTADEDEEEEEENEEPDVPDDVGTSDCSVDESDFSDNDESSTEVSSEHSDWGGGSSKDDEEAPPPPEPMPSTSTETVEPTIPKKRRRIRVSPNFSEDFLPSCWLSESLPKKTPYFPQMGDILAYFKRGHERYLELVELRKTYQLNSKEHSWMKRKSLKANVLILKIVGIRFEIRPPRLAALKCQILNQDTLESTGETFSLKYHDMNDVVDFLVLHQIFYNHSRSWSSGDRIRVQIDDCWWKGTVDSIIDAEDPFLSISVLWDNGEKELLSPWDCELLDEEASEIPDGTPVSPETLKSSLYVPSDQEWNGVGVDSESERISLALESVMSLAISEPFNYPVDGAAYPEYFYYVEYPVDLNLVKSRLDNRFYRRVSALQMDLRIIYENASSFNTPRSGIVKNAKIISSLCLSLVRDPSKTKDDVSEMYHSLVEDFKWSSGEDEDSSGGADTSSKSFKDKTLKLNPKQWKLDCRELLSQLGQQPYSAPFREPVSEIDFPDYHRTITTPMDLSLIRESLTIGNYANPMELSKDIHLMIRNSKVFNTNPKSKVLSHTKKLEEWVEPRMDKIIKSWRKTSRKINTAKNKRRKNKENEKQSSIKGKGIGKGKSNSIRKKQNPSISENVPDSSDEEASNVLNGSFRSTSDDSPAKRTSTRINRNRYKEEDDEDIVHKPPSFQISRSGRIVKRPSDLCSSSDEEEDKQAPGPSGSNIVNNNNSNIIASEKPKKKSNVRPKRSSIKIDYNEEVTSNKTSSVQISRSGRVVKKPAEVYASTDSDERCSKHTSSNDSEEETSRPKRSSLKVDYKEEHEDVKNKPSGVQVSRSGRLVRKPVSVYASEDSDENHQEMSKPKRSRTTRLEDPNSRPKRSNKPNLKYKEPDSADDHDDEEENEQNSPRIRRPQRTSVIKKEESEDDFEVHMEEMRPKRAHKPNPKYTEEDMSLKEEEEEEEEEEQPLRKVFSKRKNAVSSRSKRRQRPNPKYVEADSNEEESPKRSIKNNHLEDLSEEEKSYKNVQRRPTKGGLRCRNGRKKYRESSEEEEEEDDEIISDGTSEDDEPLSFKKNKKSRKRKRILYGENSEENELSSGSSERENRRPPRKASRRFKDIDEYNSSDSDS